MMLKKLWVLIFLLFLFVSIRADESFSLVVGTYDINDNENLKLILELKKLAQKDNSVVIYDSNYVLSKTLVIENFISEKEAIDFKEKLKAEFKDTFEKSYVVTTDLNNKFIKDGNAPKFNLLMVHSKNVLPLKELSLKYKEKIIDKKTNKNNIHLKLPIYEKGSKQEEQEGTTAVIKTISNILIDNKVLDFNFEIQDYVGYEITTVLEIQVEGNYPYKEFKEKFKSYLIDKKYKEGFILLRLSISEKDLNADEIASTSNLIKELSKLFLTWKINNFSFSVEKYSEEDNQTIESVLEKEEPLLEKSDNRKLESTEGELDGPQVGPGFMGKIDGSGGSYGQRNGGGRKRAVMKSGGSKDTESAVDWALWWLANHQEKTGHWDSGKYEGTGTPETDCATTGLALLAFLGAGYTDKVGKWKTNVKTAIAWLVAAQKPDGSWDTRNYSNGICTMAMAEAVGMGCGGSETIKSAELAVEYLLKEQNATGFFDYTGPSSRDDMSVTGWCISAYKSALLAGIKEEEIKVALQKCGNFLDNQAGTSDNTPTSKGEGWYTPSSIGTGTSGGACQAIAMLIRQFLGWERTAPWLEAAADGQITHIPVQYAGTDIYRVYYSFLALFQQGGKHWIAWNGPVSKLVVASQRQDGDFKGSWDKNGCHLDKGGRVMYTALLCLTLETYYRYK